MYRINIVYVNNLPKRENQLYRSDGTPGIGFHQTGKVVNKGLHVEEKINS